MTNKEFVKKALQVAEQKTVYMWGTFGAPVSEELIAGKARQYAARYTASRQKTLRKLIGKGYWAWDCVGLIKGILWGWAGESGKRFGGASYESNGVPDTNVSGMRDLCTDLSADWSTVTLGELVFMPGHVGIYAGAGKCIEATLSGKNDGVVVTNLAGRGWTEHGKCKFVDYPAEAPRPLMLHIQSVGLNVRAALSFKGKSTNAIILTCCPPGGDMEVLGFVPGIQPDGYQWMRVRYKGFEGYSQLDSACYYLYRN